MISRVLITIYILSVLLIAGFARAASPALTQQIKVKQIPSQPH